LFSLEYSNARRSFHLSVESSSTHNRLFTDRTGPVRKDICFFTRTKIGSVRLTTGGNAAQRKTVIGCYTNNACTKSPSLCATTRGTCASLQAFRATQNYACHRFYELHLRDVLFHFAALPCDIHGMRSTHVGRTTQWWCGVLTEKCTGGSTLNTSLNPGIEVTILSALPRKTVVAGNRWQAQAPGTIHSHVGISMEY
jgi:hypothetical protein